MHLRKISGAMFVGIMAVLSAPSVQAAETAAVEIIESVPVQHNGRIKPFLSFAAETARAVTGSDTYQKMSPALLVFSWMADPDTWTAKPMIPVTYRPLRSYFPALVKNRVSADVLLDHQPFHDLVEMAYRKQAGKQPLTTEEKEALSLYDKGYRMKQAAAGEVPGWAASANDPQAAWMPLLTLESGGGVAEIQKLKAAFAKDPGSQEATQEAMKFSEAVHQIQENAGVDPTFAPIREELVYLRMHPFGWSWKFYLASFAFLLLFTAFPQLFPKKLVESGIWTGVAFAAFGFFFHTYGFYLRCVIAGRPPVTNMYESVIWVSWAVVIVAFALHGIYRTAAVTMVAAITASFALLVAEAFPTVLDPAVSPLVPVLRSNLWLSIHVLTITFSYGTFALAWALGHVVTVRYVIWPNRHQSNTMMAQYLYRCLQIGVIFLAAGTVLGGVWANYSWGRFWGWDPKETWALIALLGYMAVLHARYAGWISVFGLAAWSVASFALVVMAWYGVNFVLAAGLHSYGFGGGGAVYVMTIFFLDFLLMFVLSKIYEARKSRVKN